MKYREWLLYLYPQAWRKRYGDEFQALLEQRDTRFFDIFDILRGALDAHLHPQITGAGTFSERWEQLMAQRMRRSIILVFCAYIGFFLASMVFAILVNDSYFLSAIQANSGTNVIFDLLIAGSIIALLAILTGGLPITLAVIRRALKARRRDVLLFGIPFLALAILAVVRLILNIASGGNASRVAYILYAILFLLAALASTAAVCVAVARNEIEERQYRFALIPATVATVAMLLVLGLNDYLGIALTGQHSLPLLQPTIAGRHHEHHHTGRMAWHRDSDGYFDGHCYRSADSQSANTHGVTSGLASCWQGSMSSFTKLLCLSF